MTVLFGIVCVVAIIFMSVFMFIGVWLLIIALQAHKQLRYKNYILEKINDKLGSLNKASNSVENNHIQEDTIVHDCNTCNPDLNYNNISSFDKVDKY